MTLAEFIMKFKPANNEAKISLITGKMKEISRERAYRGLDLDARYRTAEILLQNKLPAKGSRELLKQQIIATLERSVTGYTAPELAKMFNVEPKVISRVIVHWNKREGTKPKINCSKKTRPATYTICRQS